jgi:hypothetical protein
MQKNRLVRVALLALVASTLLGQRQVPITSGTWRSVEQFENESRISVGFRERGKQIVGWAILLGQHRKNDDRATLGLTFQNLKVRGNTVTFETMLPEDEGTLGWEFRKNSDTTATLKAVRENGEPIADDALVWEMKR